MRIAFVTLNAYDMLVGDGETVGGAQLQQVLVGRTLAERGHDVIFIENNAPHKREGTINGVQVVTRAKHDEKSVFSRAILRWIDLTALLGRLDPDTCYVRMPLFELLQTAVYCEVSNTRLVYGLAHDSELSDDPVVFESKYTDNVLYRTAIRIARASADIIIAQNKYQENLAKKQYESRVIRVPNGYKPKENPGPSPFPDGRPVVLWVSTLRSWKQPELVLQLADEIPEALFVIVGPQSEENPEVYDSVKKRAQNHENVQFEGFVPYEDIDAYFESADVFCNTSSSEGFPNTFLQAWAYGTPVVSLTVNPDSILTDQNVGSCANGDIEAMASQIRELLTGDRSSLDRLSETVQTYFESVHGIEQITDKYEKLLSDDPPSTL